RLQGMATVPISGTSIRFMSGIPFSNDYKNTRWFDNRTQQTSYFDSRNTVHSMGGQNSFQRIEGRYYVKVNKNIDDLWGTNYLTFLIGINDFTHLLQHCNISMTV